MSVLNEITATIAGTTSITPSISLGLAGLRAISLIGSWTDAPMTFQVPSPDGLSWQELYDENGNPLELIVRAGAYIDLDAYQWHGVDTLKIRSGTVDSPVVQPVDAQIALIGSFLSGGPVLPNPRGTIAPKTPTWVDSFPGMSTDEDDVRTFDLVRLLATGEEIAAIDAFALTPIGPDGVTDPAPSNRALAVASFSGTMVSQRFGNWQALPWIKYLVTASVTTSLGNTIEARGYLSVRQPLN